MSGALSLIFSLTGGLWYARYYYNNVNYWVCSSQSTDSFFSPRCSVVKIVPSNTLRNNYNSTQYNTQNSSLPNADLGLWRYKNIDLNGSSSWEQNNTFEIRDECVAYSSFVVKDSMWSTAIATLVASYAIGVLLTSMLLLSICGLRLSKRALTVIGILYMIVCNVLQGLSFLVMDSNLCHRSKDESLIYALQLQGVYKPGCSISQGGILILIGMVFNTVTGVLCLTSKVKDGYGSRRWHGEL
jgi:hypothetical protein